MRVPKSIESVMKIGTAVDVRRTCAEFLKRHRSSYLAAVTAFTEIVSPLAVPVTLMAYRRIGYIRYAVPIEVRLRVSSALCEGE